MQVRAAVLVAAVAAALASGAGSATGTTFTVTVGPGGSFAYDPATQEIRAGDTIHWVWESDFHSTTSGACTGSTCVRNGLWDSGVHDTGFTFDRTFEAAGTFPYFCSVHQSFMRGTIVVQTPTAATFASFAADRSRRGIRVTWSTGAELRVVGFNVYRQRDDGRRVRVNREIVLARQGGAGYSYSFFDRRAPRPSPVRYWLQVLALDGSRSWHGPAVTA